MSSSKIFRVCLLLVWLVAFGRSQSEPEPEPEPAPAPEPEPASETVVDIAVNSGSFTTLVAALQQQNLVDTLSGAGPFTVFAPTDAAFQALLSDLGATAEQLLARDDLTAILTYHVLSGEVMSTALSNGQTATTLQGEDITVTISGGTVMINDATVTTADVTGSNGVVHIINKVLLPPSANEANEVESNTVVDIAVNSGTFTTLVAALQQQNLVGTLSGAGPFTVFAPTDSAFATLLSELGVSATQLLARDDLTAILTYHVLAGEVMSSALSNGQKATTLQGGEITVTISGGSVMINDATVTTADVAATNGVVHVIDRVLIPPTEGPAPAPSDVNVDASSTAKVLALVSFMPLLRTLLV